jgi:STE24 endopeptidase
VLELAKVRPHGASERRSRDVVAGLSSRRLVLVLSLSFVSGSSFASSLLPEPTAQATRYQYLQDWFWCADQAMGLVVPLLVLFSGLGSRLAERFSRLTGKSWFLAIALFAIAYATIDFSLNLPLAFWEGHVTEHRFGLGTESAGVWAKAQMVGFVVRLVAVSLLTWVPFYFIQRRGRLWWLQSALAFVPVYILMYFISPIWIAPLTDSFAPLSDKNLEAKIDALAARAGIAGATVLVRDQSSTSTLPNAQVRGILATKRIVIFDTMLGQTNERELLVVVAHEMGHYVHGDLWKFMAIQVTLICLGFWAAHQFGGAAMRRFGSWWGFRSLSSVASLPLLYLGFNLVVLASTPVVNAFIRNVEHQADLFALDLTHDNDAAMNLLFKYAKVSLYVPNPGWFRRVFRADHPSLDERANTLMTYHPWTQSAATH